MAGIQLLLTEVTDEQIKIGGVANPTQDLVKVARCFNASNSPICVDAANVEAELDDAVVKAAAGADITLSYMRFAQPVIISKQQEKKASLGDTNGAASIQGINELMLAVQMCSDSTDGMKKVATNQFTENLIDAIHDAQISSEGIMELSMPVKLEFRDTAAKNAFMGIGRRKRAKATKLASAIKTVYRRQLIDMAIERLAK